MINISFEFPLISLLDGEDKEELLFAIKSSIPFLLSFIRKSIDNSENIDFSHELTENGLLFKSNEASNIKLHILEPMTEEYVKENLSYFVKAYGALNFEIKADTDKGETSVKAKVSLNLSNAQNSLMNSAQVLAKIAAMAALSIMMQACGNGEFKVVDTFEEEGHVVVEAHASEGFCAKERKNKDINSLLYSYLVSYQEDAHNISEGKFDVKETKNITVMKKVSPSDALLHTNKNIPDSQTVLGVNYNVDCGDGTFIYRIYIADPSLEPSDKTVALINDPVNFKRLLYHEIGHVFFGHEKSSADSQYYVPTNGLMSPSLLIADNYMLEDSIHDFFSPNGEYRNSLPSSKARK